MNAWSYTMGLHDLGNSVYAYLQPDGSWGWSNAGIVTGGAASLLIDTLFDLKLTQEMLDTMRKSIPAAAHIDMLVNTHANGDHCYGNQLVAGAQIIASARTAEEMVTGVSPEQMATLLKMAPAMGQLGEFMGRIFSPFEFDNIALTLPNKTFEGKLTIQVGDRTVELLEVGPAHTLGDTLVHIPTDRVIFTGKKGVVEVKGYLEYIYAEARKRYEAGMPASEAARDIPLDRYASWSEGERIAVNVISIYRELSGDQTHPSVPGLFGQMAALAL